jgi:hypothetical protein
VKSRCIRRKIVVWYDQGSSCRLFGSRTVARLRCRFWSPRAACTTSRRSVPVTTPERIAEGDKLVRAATAVLPQLTPLARAPVAARPGPPRARPAAPLEEASRAAAKLVRVERAAAPVAPGHRAAPAEHRAAARGEPAARPDARAERVPRRCSTSSTTWRTVTVRFEWPACATASGTRRTI